MLRSEIFITKINAARRQLIAAIRMYFDEYDKLAVHTVAAAANNLLLDIAKSRGMDVFDYGFIAGLYYTVIDMKDGRINYEQLGSEEREIVDFALEFSEAVEKVQKDAFDLDINKFLEIFGTILKIERSIKTEFWKKWKRAANFLKHADRDLSSAFQEKELDSERLIFMSLALYREIIKDIPWECFVFGAYYNVISKYDGNLEGLNREITNLVAQVMPEHRLEICRKLLASPPESFSCSP